MKSHSGIAIIIGMQLCSFCVADSVLAATETVTGSDVWVRVEDDASPGEYDNIPLLSVPCSGTTYTGDDGRAGCGGQKYDYTQFTMGAQWPVTVNGKTYDEADNEYYWEWTYAGYDGGGTPDWTKNCHGYAFGVGDWPVSSTALKSGGGSQCWVLDSSDATIADNDGHTVKVTMQDCMSSIGLIVKSTSEKFRESAVYTLSGDCTNGSADLYAGNGEREFHPDTEQLKLYKKN